MLDKLSCDAVEPDQFARLHDIGLNQPMRPAQGPGGAEVEWWKLGIMVFGRAYSIECAPRAVSRFHNSCFSMENGIYSVFSRMTPSATHDHKLPLTQWPKKMISVSIAP